MPISDNGTAMTHYESLRCQYLDNTLFAQEQLLYAKCWHSRGGGGGGGGGGPFDVRLHHATISLMNCSVV